MDGSCKVFLKSFVEDEAVIEIGDVQVTCLVNSCVNDISEGEKYVVELKIFILDEYLISEEKECIEFVNKIDGGYKYFIQGYLEGGVLHSCGLKFNEAAFESEYSFLEGKYISILADRIDLNFI